MLLAVGDLGSYAGLDISPHRGPAGSQVRVRVEVIRPSPATRCRDMLRDMLQGGDMQFCGIRS